MNRTVIGVLAALGVALGAYLILDRGATGDDHDETDGHHGGAVAFSAGEAGDPNVASRTIDVAMVERGDGRMLFEPAVIEVRRGEKIRFRIQNHGELAHEMVIATVAENVEHAKEMMRNPDMEHADPNGLRLVAQNRGEILWRFTKAGEFDFSCLIPGHREAGMTGKIVVR